MTSPAPQAGVNMMLSALWWARKGAEVLPLHYPDPDAPGGCSCRTAGCSNIGKHPMSALVRHGLSDASSDEAQVRDWWVQEPYANIGIRTGGIVDLLDIDSEDGLAEFGKACRRAGGPPEHLGIARSGRDGFGMHYYTAGGGQRALAGGKTAPEGIDVKGRGGYAVVAPSMHASGRRYEWVTNAFDDGRVLGAVAWPAFYAELEVRPQRPPIVKQPTTAIAPDAADAYGRAVLTRAAGLVRASRSGNRWQTLATEAVPLVARGIQGGCIDRDSGVRELVEAARAVGLDDRELHRIGPVVDYMLEQGITHPIRPSAAPAGMTDVAAPQVVHETEDEARADPWDPPWPMRHATPPFPVDEVMGWMAGPIKELSQQLQTPVDLVAMMTLATVAATIRGRVRARYVGDWEEPLNLYVAAVLGPGETKSPALSRVLAPLREMEKAARAEAKVRIADAQFNRDILDGRAKSLRDQAMKYTGDNHYEMSRMQNQAREAAESAEQCAVPTEPRWLAGDMTPEALVALMAAQNGVLAHLSAEGELLDTIVGGRYTNGSPHISALLTAHDGREPILVHRKNAPDIEVPSPSLTLGLAVQPQVLEQLGAADVAMRRGLGARFLFSVPESLVGRRDMVVREPGEAHVKFGELVRRVDALCSADGGFRDMCDQDGGSGIRGLTSTGRGFGDIREQALKSVFQESSSSLVTHYRETLEPRRRAQTGDLGEIGPWANKIDGHVIRLASLLQIIRAADPELSTGETRPEKPENPALSIGVEATSSALVLMDYLIAHAVEAHALMASSKRPKGFTAAEQLLGWVRSRGLEEFTASEAERSLGKRVTFRDPGSVQQACAVLVRLGWIRYVPPEPGKPGRPSHRYLVHPDAHHAS